MKNLVPKETIRQNAKRIGELKKQFSQGFGRTLVQGLTLFSSDVFGAATDGLGEDSGGGSGDGGGGSGSGPRKMAADLKKMTAAGAEAVEIEKELGGEIERLGTTGLQVISRVIERIIAVVVETAIWTALLKAVDGGGGFLHRIYIRQWNWTGGVTDLTAEQSSLVVQGGELGMDELQDAL